MCRLLLLTAFLYIFCLRHVSGDNKQDKCLCTADVTVGSERKVVDRFTKKAFQIYCKLHDGFRNVELKVKGKHRINKSLNFSAQFYSFNIDSLWQSLYVKLDYKFDWLKVVFHWQLTASINHQDLKRRYLDWGYANEDLLSMELIAYGQSEWRFTKPGEDCTGLEDISVAPGPNLNSLDEKDSETPKQHNFGSNFWIFVAAVCGIVILSNLVVVIFVYKIKHPRAQRQGIMVEIENGIYGI